MWFQLAQAKKLSGFEIWADFKIVQKNPTLEKGTFVAMQFIDFDQAKVGRASFFSVSRFFLAFSRWYLRSKMWTVSVAMCHL